MTDQPEHDEVLVLLLSDGGGQPQGARSWLLHRRAPVVLGRASQCDVVLEHRQVSRRHATVTWSAGGWCLEDLGSTHGTSVNGHPIPRSGRAPVRPGDELHLADVRLRLSHEPTVTACTDPRLGGPGQHRAPDADDAQAGSTLYERASRAYAAGDHLQAADLLRDDLRRRPDGVAARFALGLACAAAGDTASAARELERVLALHPQHYEAAYRLGLLREAQGDAAASARAYRAALRHADLPDARRRLSRLEAADTPRPTGTEHTALDDLLADPAARTPAGTSAGTSAGGRLGGAPAPDADGRSAQGVQVAATDSVDGTLADSLDAGHDADPGDVLLDTRRALRSFPAAWARGRSASSASAGRLRPSGSSRTSSTAWSASAGR